MTKGSGASTARARSFRPPRPRVRGWHRSLRWRRIVIWSGCPRGKAPLDEIETADRTTRISLHPNLPRPGNNGPGPPCLFPPRCSRGQCWILSGERPANEPSRPSPNPLSVRFPQGSIVPTQSDGGASGRTGRASCPCPSVQADAEGPAAAQGLYRQGPARHPAPAGRRHRPWAAGPDRGGDRPRPSAPAAEAEGQAEALRTRRQTPPPTQKGNCSASRTSSAAC